MLGQAAGNAGPLGEAALDALMGLMQHDWNVAARCAAYGLTAAAEAAVPPLSELLEQTTTALLQAQDRAPAAESPEPSDTMALLCLALGECVHVPTARVVTVLSQALVAAMAHLHAQIERVTEGLASLSGPVRTGDTGRSTGKGADRPISLAVRAASSVVDALGMVAERVVALPAGDEGTKELICNRILDALLPLSLTPDPALQIPGESLSHGEHTSLVCSCWPNSLTRHPRRQLEILARGDRGV